MKQRVIDLNNPSEPVLFFSLGMNHYTFDYLFGNSLVDSFLVEDVYNLFEINNCNGVPFTGSIVQNVYNVNTNFRIDLNSWTLFFDGSKSKDGVGVGYVLIDPKGTEMMISCILEFECTNKIGEYMKILYMD